MSASVGSLFAYDLGRTITVRNGGATYTGALQKIEHSLDLGDRPTTFLFLKADGWTHMKTYPSDTAYEVPA